MPKFIKEAGKDIYGHRLWEVECQYCHKNYTTQAYSVKTSKSTKCRKCARKLQDHSHFVKYKCQNKKLYQMWNNMIKRCYALDNKHYKNVEVCDEWKYNFDTFAEWALNNGYTEGLEIDKDKICNEQNISPKIYSPTTCIFIKHSENCLYRNNDFVKTYKRPSKITISTKDKIFKLREEGKKQQEIADLLNIKRATISHILNKRITNFNQ